MEINKEREQTQVPSWWCFFISCCPCFLGLIRDHDDLELND